MCGISGFYSLEKAFNEEDLQQMTDCMQHRGPDAGGYFLNEEQTVGLGHRRLSIIDLSTAANQPMFSHNQRYVVVFNGEVYNFAEVAKRLDIYQRTSSDTEVIIEAFARKGIECVGWFNGMFAIAIYDKHEKALYLFRDRLGVKPVYYFLDEEGMCFASEIKALLKTRYARKQVGVYKPAVSTFLYAGYIPEPYTIYDKINRLPAGSYAVIKNGEMVIKHYWKAEEKIAPVAESDFNTAKKDLKELLESSVRYRMISDVPFGTFLSGGIDSSLVTAIAQSISPKPVKTFSIGFKEATHNESQYARKVSEHLGTQHHEFTVTETDALELMDRMMNAYGEPYADSSAIPTMLVSKLARQHVTMTLSGDGGDELFLGYGAYHWAERLHQPLFKNMRGPVKLALSMLSNRHKRAAGLFNYKSIDRIKSHIFSQEQYFFAENELDALLKKEYRHVPLFNEKFGQLNRPLTVQEQQALFDIKYYLKDDLLVKVDIASMQFSLEARTPFLDFRVVEFALNLAPELKKKDGVSKYLLKEVLYDYVPRQLFDRPKWGFSIPLAKWLRTDLKYLVKDYLNADVVAACGVVNPQIVQQLIKRFDKGEVYLYNRLWVLILLHKWMKEHAA